MKTQNKAWFTAIGVVVFLRVAAIGGAETVDLVSAKGVDATGWVELASPGEGELTARVTSPEGFAAILRRVVREPRDPNAFFTDLPGFGDPVPVGVGLEDAAKGVQAKAGEKVRFRIVVPVGENARPGLHVGKVSLACGGKTAETALNLKVLDFTLPPAKSRYSNLAWLVREDGPAADWTVETSDTYAKHCAEVSVVVGSLFDATDDLMAERWRAFKVPYHALLDIPCALNPDAWRAAAVKAWQLGFDGLVLPRGRVPEPVVRAGLDDALIDVRYLSFCSELANRLADKARNGSKVVYEGRLGQFWVDRVRTGADSPDVVRLEAMARLMRLVRFAGKEASK